MANCVFTRHRNEQHNERVLNVLVNFMHTWNYRDNHDNKQHYCDMRISIIA